MLVDWLEKIRHDAAAVYLLGDIFDHWFEYKNVIPRGFSDVLGKLAELRRAGLEIHFFTGNHDMWMFGYFEEELGIPVYRRPQVREFHGKKFYLAHGDGLSNDHWSNRLMKAVFANRFLQWCFARLHPNFAIGLMKFLSRRSRRSHENYDRTFRPAKERMIDYARALSLKDQDIDYILMGHRHLPIDLTLDNGRTRYVNLGDWISHFSYAVFDGSALKIAFYGESRPVYP